MIIGKLLMKEASSEQKTCHAAKCNCFSSAKSTSISYSLCSNRDKFSSETERKKRKTSQAITVKRLSGGRPK